RILSVGAVPLDKKAISVLSMDMMKKMAEGQATKIIFPMEISKMLNQVGQYLGASTEVPEVGETVDVEKIVGKAEDILGHIPKADELRREVEKIEEALVKETEETIRTGESLKEKAMSDKSDIHIFKSNEDESSAEPEDSSKE
ncbi:MAG: hypothetical protein K8R19_01165, partial [Methanosarcinales archaeon]|nr:hypothetical protein [Methanosarcinales archaeon]